MLALHERAIRATGDAAYTAAERESWATGLAADGYLRSMADGEVFHVAEIDGVVGFCGHKLLGYGAGQVCGLYVDPAHQGCGLGHALLANAEQQLTAAGADRIMVSASLPALAFYEAHGYRQTAVDQHKTRGGLMIETRRLLKVLSGPGP